MYPGEMQEQHYDQQHVSKTTAELARVLAVVKVTSQVKGEMQILGVLPTKCIGAIKMKHGAIDYVGKWNTRAKFGDSRIIEGVSPYG